MITFKHHLMESLSKPFPVKRVSVISKPAPNPNYHTDKHIYRFTDTVGNVVDVIFNGTYDSYMLSRSMLLVSFEVNGNFQLGSHKSPDVYRIFSTIGAITEHVVATSKEFQGYSVRFGAIQDEISQRSSLYDRIAHSLAKKMKSSVEKDKDLSGGQLWTIRSNKPVIERNGPPFNPHK